MCNPLSGILANFTRSSFGLRLHVLRLIPKLNRHVFVPLLHLFMREPDLCLARVMSGDLRSGRAALILHHQMLFDLFPAWTRSVEILRAIPLDFRLTALAVLDLVAQLL